MAGFGQRWPFPRWRRDGKEIFYLSPANQMMAAEVEEKGNSMVVRSSQALFRCILVPSLPWSAPYDVSADGKKFVINQFQRRQHASYLAGELDGKSEVAPSAADLLRGGVRRSGETDLALEYLERAAMETQLADRVASCGSDQWLQS